MDRSKVNWQKTGYPSHEPLPDQHDLIKERGWDVLVVFDAARWDVFSAVVEESVKKVRTPAESSTADWVTKIWTRDDDLWDDVTYISANAMVEYTQREDEMVDYDCDVSGSVGTYVKAHDFIYDGLVGAVRPDELTEHIIDTPYEPPIVVHYMQPHTPFIGALSVHLIHSEPIKEWLPESDTASGIYQLADSEMIDNSVLRRAYIENMKIGWNYGKELQEYYDSVVYTADHGEVIGPNNWDHGAATDPRARVVPWYEVKK